MRVIHLSDTHGSKVAVPDGDILIHTGDFSVGRGTTKDCIRFDQWMSELPHKHKILVPGNHDGYCQQEPEDAQGLLEHVEMLIDRAIIIDGIMIYGSPWSVKFLDWAFMLDEIQLYWKYKFIPVGTRILATHGPAYQCLDYLGVEWKCDDMHAGSKSLRSVIEKLGIEYVLCGHIHNGYGEMADGMTTYLNSAIMNDDYIVTNKPQVFDIK